MRSIIDEGKIARGARMGKIGTFVGLGFLVGGLVISLALQASPLLWLSFVCLILGLIASSIGTMNMNRWVREPRADQALAQGLKGFDDKFRLYSYVLPVPHVLLSPLGLYVLTALGQEGTIRYDGEKFHRDFSVGRLIRFMAEEGLGKPFAEASDQVEGLQSLLEEQGIEGVDIQNILVFYHPNAQLDISQPPQPVVVPKGLKKVIRKQKANRLPSGQYEQLRELFDQSIP